MTEPTFPRCKIVRMYDGLVGAHMLAFRLWDSSKHVLIHPNHVVAAEWHVMGHWVLITTVPSPRDGHGPLAYLVVDWPEEER